MFTLNSYRRQGGKEENGLMLRPGLNRFTTLEKKKQKQTTTILFYSFIKGGLIKR